MSIICRPIYGDLPNRILFYQLPLGPPRQLSYLLTKLHEAQKILSNKFLSYLPIYYPKIILFSS